MEILGIDLAGSEKRKTGICLMDEELKANCLILFKDKEILEFIDKEKPKLIAIDAPLSLPLGRKNLRRSKIHFRKCDKELFSLGIKFFPITLEPMRSLTKRGMKLRKILKKRGFEVIEVYPGASQDLLSIPRKGKGIEKLLSGLKKLGVRGLKKNLTGDELDAITCCYTGLMYLKKNYITIGNKKEGQIILPNKVCYNYKKGRK
ncbi:hypothetical protein AMJ49_02885 [Parcubacteria bacterium DG_74_2]|nr:MAG: hypothetical protein AMJ49_02885 [Parcubacteria bacterium DG_74_2]